MKLSIRKFSQQDHSIKRILRSCVYMAFLCGPINSAVAQQQLSLNDAVDLALKNNEGLKATALEVDYYREVKKSSSDIGKFSATWMHGQYNSVYLDNNFQLTQTLPFPTVMTSLSKLGREEVIGAEKNLEAARNELTYEVRSTYLQLQYLQMLGKLLVAQDSLFENFSRASSTRYKTGESNLLEKTTADAQSLDAKNLIRQNESDVAIQQTHLQALLKTSSPVVAVDEFVKKSFDSISHKGQSNPRLEWLRQQSVIGMYSKRVERNKILPDLTFGYFNQSLRGVQNVGGADRYYSSSTRFQGFQLGLAFPLWTKPYVSRIRAAAVHEDQLNKNAEYFATTLASQYAQALQEIKKNDLTLQYYQNTALKNASLILSQAQKSFAAGEIGYVEYLQSLRNGIGIRTSYLQALLLYNQSIVKAEYITGIY